MEFRKLEAKVIATANKNKDGYHKEAMKNLD